MGTQAALKPSINSALSWTLAENLAGTRAQAEGLAEAMGLAAIPHTLKARLPWDWLPGRFWPAPLSAVVGTPPLAEPWPGVVVGCGNVAAPVVAELGRRGTKTVQVLNPKMRLDAFDVVVAPRHDGLSGPNVITVRTAVHRVSPARLAEAAAIWLPRLAHLPRPLVAVLVGGSNGRFTLDAAAGRTLAAQLAEMMQRDRVGLYLTPSRRTDPAVVQVLRDVLTPLGAEIWDGQGDNPYFGLLAVADAIVVTGDSVSMVSEACATSAPVMIARLPGKSRRIGLFLQGLQNDGRVRDFAGRMEHWSVTPLDDTPMAAAEARHRLGIG